MYLDEYKRWMAAELEDADLKPELAKIEGNDDEIKAAVVESDPTEQGERALLNLGHTVGHAVEKLKNFELLHGQCVALGTIAAALISQHLRTIFTRTG